MSVVNYGDSFYLYATTIDYTIKGWVVPIGTDPPYYVICDTCTPSSYTFVSSISNSKTGQPVSLNDTLYLANSNLDPNSYLGLQFLFGSPLDGLTQSNLNAPSNNQLQIYDLASNSNNLFYGRSSFNLSLPDITSTSQCDSTGNLNSLFGVNNRYSVGGYPTIAPIYINGCTNPLPTLYFNIVPITPYQCVNGTCQLVSLSNLSIGLPMFTSLAECNCATPPPRWKCQNNTCISGSDPTFTYGTQQQCQAQCQPPPPQLWGCVQGTCQQGTGSSYTYSTQQECTADCQPAPQWCCNNGNCTPGSAESCIYSSQSECEASCTPAPPPQLWGCIQGTCQQGPSTNPNYTYSEQSTCEAACQPPSNQLWGCIQGTCQQGTGSQYTYSTQQECTAACSKTTSKFGCINGVCLSGTGSEYTYNSITECLPNCRKPKPPERWWIWLLLIGSILFLIIVVIIVFLIFRRKPSPPPEGIPLQPIKSAGEK